MTDRPQRTVLVTGFGPFGRHAHNPSGELAELLDGAELPRVRLVGRRFATSTSTIGRELSTALADVGPDAVICLGLAPGRPLLSLERVAVNVRDFPIPDATGEQLLDEPVVPDGPDALFTGLPIRAILTRWRHDDVPAHVSNTAGTYLCNQLFYLACTHGRRLGIPAGFIHIPDTARSAAVAAEGGDPGPTLELSTMAAAVRTAAAITVGADEPVADASGAGVKTGAVD